MYTLYYSPGTASMCVHQALIEANVQYTLVLVDLQAGHQRDPALPVGSRRCQRAVQRAQLPGSLKQPGTAAIRHSPHAPSPSDHGERN